MSRLIHADLRRMRKNATFLLCALFMCGLGIVAVVMRYLDLREDPNAYATADGFWFLGGMSMSIVLSVLVSLYLGTEYNDGTLRNKLIVGHTRGAIYAAAQLTCTVSAIFLHLLYILSVVLTSTLLLEPFKTPMSVLVQLTAVSLLTVAAMTSIFVAVAMCVSSRSSGAVVAILIALAMLMLAYTVESRLCEPEYIETSFQMSLDGEIVQGDPIPNPKYLRDTERDIYQLIHDIHPLGQMMQLVQLKINGSYVTHICIFIVCSILVNALATAVGYTLFRRKDIN